MNFADTNWLTAMYFESHKQADTVARFLRSQKSSLAVSQIVMLEARNVFSRQAGENEPREWKKFEEDTRFYRDPMNWDLLRRDVFGLIFRYGAKENLGSFDLAMVASARLAGATRMLSFDAQVAALSVAEGLEIFPDLTDEGRKVLSRLKLK